MNLHFGLSLILFAVGVFSWAILGSRLVSLPVVGSLVAFLAGLVNGDHNTPQLTVRYSKGVAQPLVDGERLDLKPLELPEPEYKPGLIARLINGDHNLPSDQAVIDAPRYKAGLLVEPMLDSFGKPISGYYQHPQPPRGGLLGWLAGGYNIPSEAEVDALARWREKHYTTACFKALRDAWATDDGSALVWRHDGSIDLDCFNPMPEAQNQREVLAQHRAAAEFSRRWDFKVRLDGLHHPGIAPGGLFALKRLDEVAV